MNNIKTTLSILSLFLILLIANNNGSLAFANVQDKKFTVVVFDLAHAQEEDSELRVTGFPTYELAKEFARRRVRDSIEELRKPNQTKEELKKLWLIYGENALIEGDEKKYNTRSEIDFFIEHPATQEERDWQVIKKKAGIK